MQLQGAVLADRFRLEHLIGEGGYGAVYRAVQLSVERPCAVKVLAPELCDDERTEQRFRIEARTTSRLTHPNTVVLYDFGRDEARSMLFLAMELLEGRTVDEYVERQGPMAASQAAPVVRQAAGSLREAHCQGMIHRDVKPHNLMLVERGDRAHFVKVIDFGIAKALRADVTLQQSLTATGMMIGSPAYMAPEQIRAGEMDGRSDQYALAMTTYYMLTGRTPFEGGTSMQVASRHLTEKPPAASALRPGVEIAGRVEEVLKRAAAKDKEDRFEDVEAFAEAFERAAASSPETSQADEEPSGTMAVPQTAWAGAGGEDEGAGQPQTAEVSEATGESPESSRRAPTWPVADSETPLRWGRLAAIGLLALVLGGAAAYWALAERAGGGSSDGAGGEPAVATGGERTDAGAAPTESDSDAGGNRGEDGGSRASGDVGAGDGGREAGRSGEPAVAVDQAEIDVRRAGASSEATEEPAEETSAARQRGAAGEGDDSLPPRDPGETSPAREDEAGRGAPASEEQEPSPSEPADGRLEVRMIPWGTLVVDGEAVGSGTSVETTVPAARHRVEMKQGDEVVASEEIRVDGGGSVSLEMVAQ